MSMLDFSYIPAKNDGSMVREAVVDTSFPHSCQKCGETFYATKDTALTLCIPCERNKISESELRVLDGNR